MTNYIRDLKILLKTIVAMVLATTISACGATTVFVVTTDQVEHDQNPGDGICSSLVLDGACTLQAAIDEANAMPQASNIAIILQNTGTYNFIPESTDGLTIEPGRRVTITGSSDDPELTTVQPNHTFQEFSRVFTVRGSSLELFNLRIRGGALEMPPSDVYPEEEGYEFGGAILAEQGAYYLAISNCIVEENSAALGGGVFAAEEIQGRLLILDSIIRRNNASPYHRGGGSGGVQSRARYTGIVGSLIEKNDGRRGGLGIRSSGDDNVIVDSTFYDNTSQNGGGIYAELTNGKLAIRRSTISTNLAGVTGGGIWVDGGVLELDHVTITKNRVNDVGSAIVAVGDVVIQVMSSIIADNRRRDEPALMCYGDASVVSGGHNVLDNVSVLCNMGPQFFDVVGFAEENETIDRGLGDYQPAPIGHHPLEADSIAVDLGGDILNGCDGFDQIGASVPFDGDNDGSDRCDAGAIELHLGPTMAGKLGYNAELTKYRERVRSDIWLDSIKPAKQLAQDYNKNGPEKRVQKTKVPVKSER